MTEDAGHFGQILAGLKGQRRERMPEVVQALVGEPEPLEVALQVRVTFRLSSVRRPS